MQSPTASLKKKRRDSKLKDAKELAALKLKSKKNVATNSSQKNMKMKTKIAIVTFLHVPLETVVLDVIAIDIIMKNLYPK